MLLKVFCGQNKHCLWLFAPVIFLYVPGLQWVHGSFENVSEYVPTAHETQILPCPCVPGEHGITVSKNV